ncbi:hypothetical protein [Candidatus Odyssella thessalonicensis]|uniref:hypothetical protein n=1 Tax=Candidatus Odyssella thessalonicensis TaxID=84647 RepID=UPI000225BFBD|nr:hypothetical protein [Candidatus Odyssella thessalonicensis]
MVKNINTIKDELIEKGRLSPQSIQDLKWHLQNDLRPHMAIILATDAHLKELGPLIATKLDDEDDFIREVAVGCLIGRLFLTEYAPKALELAKEDPYENVRGLAISNLGAVIDAVDKELKKEISSYIYEIISNSLYNDFLKECAYHSIVVAMEVPVDKWPKVKKDGDIHKLMDKEILEAFKKKYSIEKQSNK